MRRVHVICEGSTEETFVNELLLPLFKSRNISLCPALIGQPGKKGGNVTYKRLLDDVRNRLLGDRTAFCTTFFDYYGLPSDFPGKLQAKRFSNPQDSAAEVCSVLTRFLEQEIGTNSIRRFIPYVQMHEFEGLLFSDPASFAKGIEEPTLQSEFARIRRQFITPEHINDGPNTAPSKRVLALVSSGLPYEKSTLGTLAALEIGLPRIRQECPLFDAWIAKLEDLTPLPA